MLLLILLILLILLSLLISFNFASILYNGGKPSQLIHDDKPSQLIHGGKPSHETYLKIKSEILDKYSDTQPINNLTEFQEILDDLLIEFNKETIQFDLINYYLQAIQLYLSIHKDDIVIEEEIKEDLKIYMENNSNYNLDNFKKKKYVKNLFFIIMDAYKEKIKKLLNYINNFLILDNNTFILISLVILNLFILYHNYYILVELRRILTNLKNPKNVYNCLKYIYEIGEFSSKTDTFISATQKLLKTLFDSLDKKEELIFDNSSIQRYKQIIKSQNEQETALFSNLEKFQSENVEFFKELESKDSNIIGFCINFSNAENVIDSTVDSTVDSTLLLLVYIYINFEKIKIYMNDRDYFKLFMFFKIFRNILISESDDISYIAKINIYIVYVFLIAFKINTQLILIKSNASVISFIARSKSNLGIMNVISNQFLYYLLTIFSMQDQYIEGSELLTNENMNLFRHLFNDLISLDLIKDFKDLSPTCLKLFVNFMLFYKTKTKFEFEFDQYSVIELKATAIAINKRKEILDHINFILSMVKKKSKQHVINTIFKGEMDNNRDKFLNNLGLLIVGFNNTTDEYICILLYPFLFKAYKEYQVYLDTLEVSKENRVFNGGGKYDCNIDGCICTNFIPSEFDLQRCSNCNHFEPNHNDNLRGKRLLKTKFLPKIREMNIRKKKLKFILDLYKNIFYRTGIPEMFKFFAIPKDMAKKWQPMLIKSFSEYKKNYSNLYHHMRKFIVKSHGRYIRPDIDIGENYNIDLEPNEIVIMSCNPFVPVTSNRINVLKMEFVSPSNNATIHYLNILDFLNSNKETRDRMFSSDRNNYCMYTKKCPNLVLQHYDYGSEFQDNLPYFTFESPMRYSSPTIADLIMNLNSTPEKKLTREEIFQLGLNLNPDDEKTEEILQLRLNNDLSITSSPNLIKYLFDDIDSLQEYPILEQLQTYKLRINNLVDKLGAQEDLEIDNREIKTYYKYIDFRKEKHKFEYFGRHTSNLQMEIDSIREYNKSEKLNWDNNPDKKIIIFVGTCRS
jgi:hypothetical protein